MKAEKKRVLDMFKQLIPIMSDNEIERLLAFGEGMVFMKKRIKEKEVQENK